MSYCVTGILGLPLASRRLLLRPARSDQHVVVDGTLCVPGVAPSAGEHRRHGPEVDRVHARRLQRVLPTRGRPEVVALVDDELRLVALEVGDDDLELAFHAVEGLVPAHFLPRHVVHVGIVEAEPLAVVAGSLALARDEDAALAPLREAQARHRGYLA